MLSLAKLRRGRRYSKALSGVSPMLERPGATFLTMGSPSCSTGVIFSSSWRSPLCSGHLGSGQVMAWHGS